MAKKKAGKKAARKKAKKSTRAKVSAKSRAPKKAASSKRKAAAAKAKPSRRPVRGKTYSFEQDEVTTIRANASDSAGQSGDIQGLSDVAEADSESVEELAEEGQDLEAEAIDGVENAPDADRGPVRTREVPEDDVPEEYLDKDQG